MFVNLEIVIYALVRSSLLPELILMFCLIKVMSLSQNAGIENDWRHETQRHGYTNTHIYLYIYIYIYLSIYLSI